MVYLLAFWGWIKEFFTPTKIIIALACVVGYLLFKYVIGMYESHSRELQLKRETIQLLNENIDSLKNLNRSNTVILKHIESDIVKVNRVLSKAYTEDLRRKKEDEKQKIRIEKYEDRNVSSVVSDTLDFLRNKTRDNNTINRSE